jgi:hypothetical protein
MGLSIIPTGDTEIQSDTLLWRYLSFDKFMDMIAMRRLYFRRADKLEDPFECNFPPELYSIPVSGKSSDQAMEFHKSLHGYVTEKRSEVYLNCWHTSEYESDAMWKLYGGREHSIAIASRVSSFTGQLSDYNIISGNVKYTSIITDTFCLGHITDFALIKRKSFEHEKEFRFIFDKSINDPSICEHNTPGISIGIDPDILIEGS